MNAYDNASLIVYPSGYKESKIYAQKPIDGTGDLTFARASSATRVNAEGLIETVPYNLINYSQDFTNGVWTPNGVVATLNSGTAPDGTNTLNDVSSDNSGVQENRFRYATSLAVSTTYTISIFCKVKDINNFYIRDLTGGGGVSIINVATSTALVTGSGSTISIVDFGSGIKRVIVTFTTPSSIGNNLIDFGITSSNTDRQSAIAIGSGMYFWGAMINEGSSAKTYQKTESGLNVPRIDFTGGGCGSLLLEPQRTNTIPYSDDFATGWSNAGTNIITSNATASPTGDVNADKITVANNFGQHYLRLIINGHTVGAAHTLSVFAKAGELDVLTLRLLNGGDGNVTFDLTNGVITSGTNGKIEDYGNGWYRCIAYHSSATSTYLYPYLYVLDGNAQGDGTSGFYWYGAQLEAGSYATSLINTSGTTVTRVADTSSTTGLSSLMGQTEGVLYAKIAAFTTSSPDRSVISIGDGTTSNQIAFWYDINVNEFKILIRQSGNKLFHTTTLTDATQFIKVAVLYKSGSSKVYINGSLIHTAAGTFTFTSPLSVLDLGGIGLGGTDFNGKLQELQLFPSALDDATLATLTTL